MIQPPADELEQIESLLKAGQISEAKLLLAKYLRANPTSVRAWWLMSQALADPPQKAECLNRILRLDPDFFPARDQLERLGLSSGQPSPVPAPSAATPAATPTEPSSPPIPTSTAPVTPPVQPAIKAISTPPQPQKASKSKLLLTNVFMGMFLGAVLLVSGFYLWQNRSARQARDQASTRAVAALLTSLPTLTPTFTYTPTLTRTPRPTATETPTPTLTRTPRGTNTVQVRPGANFTAPDFSLVELTSGQTVTLRQFAGQPVLVIFWATWCPHCRDEMGALNQLQKDYSDKGLVILAINTGDSQSSVSSYRTYYQLTFQILLDTKKAVSKDYNVTGIPMHYFIKPNGIISYVVAGGLPYDFLAGQVDVLLR